MARGARFHIPGVRSGVCVSEAFTRTYQKIRAAPLSRLPARLREKIRRGVSTRLQRRRDKRSPTTLSDTELGLYDRIAESLDDRVPRPDLVVLLQDSVENTIRRIRTRGRGYERGISETFITRLHEAYTHFFFHYKSSPLLVVNVSQVDFVNRPEDLEQLLQQIESPPAGTRYYRPVHVEVQGQ